MLAILVIESLRAPKAGPPMSASALAGEDSLVLRLGRVPEPGEPLPDPGAIGAPPATEAPAATPGADATAPPAMSPDQYYVVQPGDTLSSIAKEQLGSALLAGELARINRLSDPNQLEVGQILYLR
ncbi:MAG TPA: LysM domain-containing protein [Candidatus Limnocylindrales bacterium]|nr:LysM domain-containing protein [Candidatus Limnocylindrales bacterium]